MSRDKGVILAFLWLGVARHPSKRAEGVHGRVPPRQDLVGIALVSHVKNHSVPPGIKYPVERYGDLHRTEIGGQMSSRA